MIGLRAMDEYQTALEAAIERTGRTEPLHVSVTPARPLDEEVVGAYAERGVQRLIVMPPPDLDLAGVVEFRRGERTGADRGDARLDARGSCRLDGGATALGAQPAMHRRARGRTRSRRRPAAARASGSSTRSKRIGSPYWTVTFGNCRRFQLRTFDEPWIATGTTGAPVSSASRPMPGLARSASLPVRERPPSQYMHDRSRRASRIVVGGDERLLVAVAAAHREHAAVACR